LIPYPQAWELQEQIAQQIGGGELPPMMLLLEHPPVYTFGRRGGAKNLLWDETELARHGVSVMWVDRGGDVTYHGPGQLVGYRRCRGAGWYHAQAGQLATRLICAAASRSSAISCLSRR
jgi:lipoyl(octanoyl) transferase